MTATSVKYSLAFNDSMHSAVCAMPSSVALSA